MKAYYEENEKFMKRWNFAAGRRARKHLLNIYHLVRERRGEISHTMYKEGKEDE
jgi:riboflavin synthase